MHTTNIQGVEVPSLGFGTFQLSGDDCQRGVEHALSVGYRHLDTAQAYDNEERVGAGMGRSGVDRAEIFLTTKLDSASLSRDRVEPAVADSLKKLRTDYVDLLLIHWPSRDTPTDETLAAMREVQEEGRVRQIGVSNFPPSQVEAALEQATIFCNQVEHHPFLGQGRLRELAVEHDLLLTAYAPLAQGDVMSDPTLQEIAEAHGATPAQVALRWLVEQDHVCAIPKATSPERIESNLAALDLELSDEELRRVDGLERGGRVVDPDFAPDWED
jgi:2,5-diketo-D-gluconate reductase B